MRWYLNDGHQTHGPMTEQELIAMIRRGFRGQVMSDPGGTWMPIGRSPFASQVTLETKMTSAADWASRGLVALVVLFILGFVVLVVVARLSR
jgi:hypothetical protein